MTLRRARPYWAGKGGGGFEPEYQAVLDRASFLGYTTPDSTTNNRNNTRVKNLKDTGIWVKLDLLYMFDQHTGLADFAKLNYIDPSNFEAFNSNPALEPNFVADSGFESDGTLWFDSGWNPTVDPVNVVVGDSTTSRLSVFYKGFNFAADSTVEGIIGNFGTGNQVQVTKLSNDTTLLVRPFINSGGNEPLLPTQNNNHILLSMSGFASGLDQGLYIDGVFDQTTTASNGSPAVNLTFYIFAINSNGTAVSISNSGLSYIGLGGYLGGSDPNQEAIDLYNIMNDTYTP